MRQADIDEGTKPGKSTSDSEELQDLRRRNRLLEHKNEMLRSVTLFHLPSLSVSTVALKAGSSGVRAYEAGGGRSSPSRLIAAAVAIGASEGQRGGSRQE